MIESLESLEVLNLVHPEFCRGWTIWVKISLWASLQDTNIFASGWKSHWLSWLNLSLIAFVFTFTDLYFQFYSTFFPHCICSFIVLSTLAFHIDFPSAIACRAWLSSPMPSISAPVTPVRTPVATPLASPAPTPPVPGPGLDRISNVVLYHYRQFILCNILL